MTRVLFLKYTLKIESANSERQSNIISATKGNKSAPIAYTKGFETSPPPKSENAQKSLLVPQKVASFVQVNSQNYG